MLTYDTSFGRSLGVLNALMVHAPDLIEARVEAYQNGREQGFLIHAHDPWFDVAYYVAQQRTSDSLVVYKGTFTMQSISEDAYKNPRYCDTTEEAINFLLDELWKGN